MTQKILIISDNLPDQINGVVTTYKNIEIYAAGDDYDIHYLHPGSYNYINCPFYKEVKLALTTPSKVGYAIEKISPDYIHISTEGPMGVCARYYLSRRGYNYTSAYHTKFPEAVKKMTGIPESVTWRLIRWIHSKSETVLTTTESMVEQLKSKGFKNPVMPWTRGADRSIFYPQYPRGVNHTPILLNVGRVSQEKNLEEFYKLDIPNCRKIQVGNGPMLETYKRKYPDVEFVGAKRGKELARYYQQADVFVFPSKWDTFGIVMVESINCGTPVAAFPVQGPLDVINTGINGILDDNLKDSVLAAMNLERRKVYESSRAWSWHKAWEIFRDNLVAK